MSDATRTLARLNAEGLEDRTVPTVSTIASNFNGTAIPAGDSVWFSNVAKVSGLGSAPATVHVTDQTISFTAGGTQYTVAVPDSTVVFDPNTASAATAFDGQWLTATPGSFSGNVFLSGVSFQAGNGLPGGIKNVVWSGDFTSDTAGLTINWQWAAAVYKQFSADPSALGVKASDARTAQYQNSDHAGTPEAFKSSVVGGARGGGGSNFTGSYSGTASIKVEQIPPGGGGETGSISGHVYFDANQDGVPNSGIGQVVIHLTGTNDLGEWIDLTTTTADDGSYNFAGLRPGTYSLAEEQPDGYADGKDYLGSLGGAQNSNDEFDQVVLAAGQNGVNYDYTELLAE